MLKAKYKVKLSFGDFSPCDCLEDNTGRKKLIIRCYPL